ncbi:MAG TPA: S41 family peptidase [Flavobacteriaceae bacterium]|nr:S41 family peptidase [Flavobacteriaceae bacterium]
MKLKKKILIPSILVALLVLTAAKAYKSSPFFEIAKQIEIFTTLYKEVNMNYVDETNPAHLMTTAMTAMLEELDPYTVYYNEQDVQQARIRQSGEYTGIGAAAEVQKDKIIITELFKNSPADKAGLKVGDEIIKIGDVKVSDFEEDAAQLLKGAPGSKVSLTYLRQGKPQTTVLAREEVEIHAVPYFTLLDGNVGYVVLSKFNRKASSEVKAAVEELKKQGATKIILDLRNNPGGLLQEAVQICNLFLPKNQLIVTTKSTIEKYNETFVTQKEPLDLDIPLAVLVNGRSASASEIVAGSLQDLDRAVIIGARSFGKGLVQRPKKLPYGAQMKITIARYYTPSGRCIQSLDYWHRDEEGNPVRVKASEYTEFKTENGRPVFDGGGIMPDIALETSKITGITEALLEENAIFDFATQYYYSHQLENPADFKFTDSDYQEFLKFLKATDFQHETETEEKLRLAFEISKKEDLNQEIEQEYKNLMASIEAMQQTGLKEKKPAIISLLTDEIIKRYFYQEGLYKYYVNHNPEIEKAKEVLNDPQRYAGILN